MVNGVASSSSNSSSSSSSSSSTTVAGLSSEASPERVTPATPPQEEEVTSSPLKLSDVLKRKRGPKRGAIGARKSRTCTEDTSASMAGPGCSMDPGHDYLRSSGSPGSTGTRSKFGFASGSSVGSNGSSPTVGGGTTKASSFLASLNPARWGRSHHHSSATTNTTTSSSASSASLPNVPKSLSNPQLAGNREKVKTWIREQAVLFLATYFSTKPEAVSGSPSDASGGIPALSVLGELTSLVERLDQEAEKAQEVLKKIRAIVTDSDVSSFEILHSGLVRSMLKYLTADTPQRNDRLRTFLRVSFHSIYSSINRVSFFVIRLDDIHMLS